MWFHPRTIFPTCDPSLISFRTGGLITGVVGVCMMPWKLLSDFSAYIFGWLVGYSGLLGPVAGVMIADYFILRRARLKLDDLYCRNGAYEYDGGVNWRAVIALGVGHRRRVVGLGGFATAVSLRLRVVCGVRRGRGTVRWLDATLARACRDAGIGRRGVNPDRYPGSKRKNKGGSHRVHRATRQWNCGTIDTEDTEKQPVHSNLSPRPLGVLLCDLCVKRFFGQ